MVLLGGRSRSDLLNRIRSASNASNRAKYRLPLVVRVFRLNCLLSDDSSGTTVMRKNSSGLRTTGLQMTTSTYRSTRIETQSSMRLFKGSQMSPHHPFPEQPTARHLLFHGITESVHDPLRVHDTRISFISYDGVGVGTTQQSPLLISGTDTPDWAWLRTYIIVVCYTVCDLGASCQSASFSDFIRCVARMGFLRMLY